MSLERIRSPICVVVGHVDAGKTSILDSIRGSIIALKEPGAITQTISSTFIPTETIRKICGPLLDRFKFEITVPGLLFIDTPGHEAFTSLRKRGGSIADLAVLVIDIMEGIMPQTEESIEILKTEKTPFLVAVNKVDKIQGWRSDDKSFLKNYKDQNDVTKNAFEEKFYSVISQLSMRGFGADRFDRINDFRTTAAAIPISAKTGEGVPELLAVLIGLSQQFLHDKLKVTERAKGNILEIKETVGLGKTMDVILYDGALSRNDYIVIGGREPRITKIKALLLPAPLSDIRTEKRFTTVDCCCSACGVKIVAPNIDGVASGACIVGVKNQQEAEAVLEQLIKEKEELEISTEADGIVLIADTIGSLEALLNIFKNYSIRGARIGSVAKEDIVHSSLNKDWKNKALVAFNSPVSAEVKKFAEESDVKLLESNIIYHLIENYEKWLEEKKEEILKEELDSLIKPAKITLLPGCVFRQSNPLIVGCEVSGLLKPGYSVFKFDNEIKEVGEIKQIQKEGTDVKEAKSGERVAISIIGPVIGRQVNEGDSLYSDIPSQDCKQLKKHIAFLTTTEKKILDEIIEMKRKNDKGYGL
ncbi:MAG: translation initiation factor IF-2 [Candidatus Aenigmarchaeota archaeon]|nr:translation initiation factor IF-2 [Candidatus Aenigmarchaeota archaeon]